MNVVFKNALDLVVSYFLRGKTDVSQIEYYPQKVRSSLDNIEKGTLPRATPESCGVDSWHISQFLAELERSKRSIIHSVVIVKGGSIISSASAPGYSAGSWHLVHSMSKSFTSLAVGMLCDDGLISLDDKLDKYIKCKMSSSVKKLTVKNLLEMSASIGFGELGSVMCENWTQMFCEADASAPAGEKFSYNSMNSFILAKIVKQISGKDVFELLRERLFEPLGIENVMWEKSPEDISKGGWGLYISAEDAAKVGYMCLSGGSYDGKRIISEEYLRLATTTHMLNSREDSDYNYGYHFWVNKNGRSYLFNGMFGQNVWVCPENDMVISVNSGNGELFQNSSFLDIVKKYFDPDNAEFEDRLKENRRALAELRAREDSFFSDRAFCRRLSRPTRMERFKAFFTRKKLASLPRDVHELDGKRFSVQKNNFGIIPTVVRVMQSNHSMGIERVLFDCEHDKFFVTFVEGNLSHRMEIGFFDYAESELDMYGEKYRVHVLGNFTESEKREPMLKLEIVFPELPNVRTVKFFFGDMPTGAMTLDENPGREMMDKLMGDLQGSLPRSIGLLSIIKPEFNIELIKYKVLAAFSPTLTLTDEDSLPVKLPVDSSVIVTAVMSDSARPEDEMQI